MYGRRTSVRPYVCICVSACVCVRAHVYAYAYAISYSYVYVYVHGGYGNWVLPENVLQWVYISNIAGPCKRQK